jgi:hypothetical protein
VPTNNGLRIPQAEDANYLKLDRTKLETKLEKTYTLTENNLDFNWKEYIGYSAVNQLSAENKLLLDKIISIPIWTYGV